MKWAMEVGALGRGRSWGPGRVRRGAGSLGWHGHWLLPLEPGGLCYLVTPGGPTKAGDRRGGSRRPEDPGPILGDRNTLRDTGTITSGQAGTCPECQPPPFLHLNLPQVDPAPLPIFPVCPSQVLIGPCSIKWLILSLCLN